MINLRHIEIFHAVYQTGSLSGAARLLGVSQPSVSKVLRHAESRLGFVLFRVVKGRLIPTDEAHELFAEAHAVQDRVEILHETARNLRRAEQGRLRIAMIHSLGLEVVPDAIAAFAVRHPNVSIDLRTLHSEELAETLHARTSDIAIGYDVPRHPRFAHLKLGSGQLVLLFRRQDIPDPPERISLSAIEELSVIQLINDGTIGTLANRRTVRDQAGYANIQAKTYFVAAALVARGLGVAIIDEFTARACATAEMAYRPIDEPLRFEVIAMHLEDRPLSTISRHFLDGVRDALAASRP